MARDEESNGNGNGSSGKSGRQDSSLSARRARLRSLAKQALPPDPYSKKPEGTQEDAPSLELEFLDKAQGAAGGAIPATPAQGAPATEPWLGDAMSAVTAPGQDPNSQPQPLPQGYQALSSDKYPAVPQDYQQTPVPPIAPMQSGFGSDPQSMGAMPRGFGGDPQQQAPMPGGFGGDQQQQGAMPGGFAGEQQQQQTPMGMPFGQEHSMPNMPAADPGFSFSEPSFGTLPADPDQSFESFMQGPAESPTSFMSNPVADPTPPSAFPMPSPDPNFGQQDGSMTAAEPTAPATPQSQAVEQSYLQHSPSEKDFTSKLDLDYGDLEDEVPPEPEPEPQPEPFSPLLQTHTQSQTQTQVITTMPMEPESTAAPVQSQAPEPEPAATDDDMNAWESNNKSKKKENAWSVEEEAPVIPELPEVPEAPEIPEVVAEAPAVEIEEVLEEQPKEQAPVQRKRSRKKAEPEPEEVEKEPEIKPVDGESQDEDKVISVWKKAIDDEEARVKSRAASDLANKKGDEEETPSKSAPSSKDANRTAEAAPPVVQVPVELLTKTQAEALEMLTSIDQALGICAMNLSSMQTASNEQTDVLKNLQETLQNQTFFELGLNLNTLMESMSAALEPMKAVGELVPAIDQLVSAMVSNEEKEQKTRMSPDKLVMGLADQLGAGQIDPWTFKCAYMALFPDEHPADLLHRLVELLGTQKVSGELFRSAYDAVQAAEPVRVNASGEVIKEVIKEVIVEVVKEVEVEVVKVVPDEEVVRELEDLKRAHEDMRLMLDDKDSDLGRRFEEREKEFSSRLEDREAELTKRLEERETEYAELLAAKEHEIQETQEMLHSRFEEFNSRYEEMVETVNQRDEELKVKDDEVMRRESEISQLKAQLDELKDSFKDTVENLQKQLTSSQKAAQEANMQAQAISQQRAPVPQPEESPKPQGSFFDQDSSKQQQSQTQAPNAFGGGGGDGGAARPLFQHQVDTFNSMSKMPKEQAQPTVFGGPPTPGAPPTPPDSFGGGAPPTGPIPETSTQAVPKPPQPTPGMSPMNGSGSYGSGVRAQVFEVIVRQALAGAPWREICAGPMSVNNISPEEVEGEVKRREALLKK